MKKTKERLIRFNLISLAELLGKTIAEIEDITLNEYNEWVAYFKIVDERREEDGKRRTAKV